MQKNEKRWTSERLFLLASIGGAVGLGNLWRFPFIAGENGGGAFVLVYLGFVVLIGLPLLLAEFAIGRKGGGSCLSTMENIINTDNVSGFWKSIGWLSLCVPFLGFCYYSSVVGWTIHYSFLGAIGTFDGITPEQSGKIMGDLQSNPSLLIGYHTALISLTVLVVARGLKGGIEKVVKWMMPALFVMLVSLALYASIAGDFGAAVDFLFTPDFSKLTAQSVLIALGQVFFSMAIGVGMMITYSAYLPKSVSLSRASAVVGLGDTLVAILAGLAIFPIVFGFGLSAGEGPHLLFVTLPVGLGSMTGSTLLSTAFFILLFFAGFTSVIGMLEPIVSTLEDRSRFTRSQLATMAGVTIWFVGLAPTLSGNLLSDVRPLWFIPLMADFDIFRVFDFFVASLILPLNGFLIAVFAGWVLMPSSIKQELGLSDGMFKIWQTLVRYVAPIAVAWVLVSGIIAAFGG